MRKRVLTCVISFIAAVVCAGLFGCASGHASQSPRPVTWAKVVTATGTLTREPFTLTFEMRGTGVAIVADFGLGNLHPMLPDFRCKLQPVAERGNNVPLKETPWQPQSSQIQTPHITYRTALDLRPGWYRLFYRGAGTPAVTIYAMQ